MIDFDFADAFADIGCVAGGGIGLLFLVLALVFYVIASNNQADCRKTKVCNPGAQVELLHGECLCVEKPQEDCRKTKVCNPGTQVELLHGQCLCVETPH